MKQSRWSPADLDRQRLFVHRIALRTELDLRQLEAARDRFVADVRSTLGGPLALMGCFVAGVVVGGREPPQPRADERRRFGRWLARAAVVLRTIVLSASTHGALLRSVVASP
jgi:hypothetical protein